MSKQIKISKNWNRLAEEIYLKFGEPENPFYDFSESAKEQLFVWESLGRKQFRSIYGIQDIPANNGFSVGKHSMDIMVSEFIAAIRGYKQKDFKLCALASLYSKDCEGHALPKWWVDSVVPSDILAEFPSELLKAVVEEQNKLVTVESIAVVKAAKDAAYLRHAELRADFEKHIVWTKDAGWRWKNWRGIIKYFTNNILSLLKLKNFRFT